MEQEQAIDKIKKLLRLSESPNENEAQVALKKARELMLQYHVTEGSLDAQDKNTIWKEVVMEKKWMGQFYNIICANNRCDCYTSTRHHLVDGKYKLLRKIHIVGYPFDVECVIVMAQLVEDTVKRGIKEFRENARQESSSSTKGVTDSYVYGFACGLKRAFDEQNAKQEFHLMCLTPQEVKDEMNAVENLRHRRQTIKLGISANEVRALAHGEQQGYETGIRRQLGDA